MSGRANARSDPRAYLIKNPTGGEEATRSDQPQRNGVRCARALRSSSSTGLTTPSIHASQSDTRRSRFLVDGAPQQSGAAHYLQENPVPIAESAKSRRLLQRPARRIPAGKQGMKEALMKFLEIAALVTAASFVSCGSAGALTFRTPINGLVGTVGFTPSSGGQDASFDFGREFVDIENVWIEIEANATARQFDVCSDPLDPNSCVHTVQLLGFFARLDKEGSPILGTVSSEGLSFSNDFSALEGSGTDVALFNNLNVGWDFLLDGQGRLTLFWNRALGDPDRLIQNLVEPTGQIISAHLIVEGTPIPIPEPSAMLLGSLGLLGLSLIRFPIR